MTELRKVLGFSEGFVLDSPPAQIVPSRPLVRERLYELVRDAIIEGRIAPGTRITERELCECFGVSRTVVREVVRMLAAEKLANVEKHRGLTVARLDARQVAEIYQIRTELEAIVVRSFLAAATEADIATAQEFGDRLLSAGAAGDFPKVVATMAEFEAFQTRVAGTGLVAEILTQLKARVSLLRLMALRQPGQIEIAMEGVRAIINGITLRDASAAEQAVRVFVRHSEETVLRQMAAAEHPEQISELSAD